MSHTCPPGHYSDARIINALTKKWRITLKDIKSHWMDLMVKRLFRELNKQLCQVEATKAERLEPADRLVNARVLDTLQRTLERLSLLERERDAYRIGKNVAKDANARKSLERKLDKLLAEESAGEISQKPDQ